MKLQTQFLFALLILLAALTGSIVYNDKRQSSNLDTINRERIHEFAQTFQSIIDLKVSNTKAYAYDYSHWDEMVEFVANHDQTWAKYNIDETMKTFGADYTYVIDRHGKRVYHAYLNESQKDIYSAINKEDFNPNKPIFNSYFIDVDHVPVEIFVAPIQNSADVKRIGKPYGYLVMAKIWTPAFIQEFAKITKQKTELSQPDETYSYVHSLKGRNGEKLFGLGITLSTTTNDLLQDTFKTNIYSIAFIGMLGIIGFGWFVYRRVVIPLDNISEAMQNGHSERLRGLIGKKDEFGRIATLVESFFIQKINLLEQLQRADEAEREQKKLQLELQNINIGLEAKVQSRTRELEEINRTLDERVKEEIGKRRKQEQLLMQQNRLASMGEMIGNIAHQWRQPLNTLGLIVQDAEDAFEYGDMNQDYIQAMTTKAMDQINYMSQTIEDFRNFFNPQKDKKYFSLRESVQGVLDILGPNSKKHEIEYEENIADDLLIYGYQSEFSQVLFNLLKNANDALIISQTLHPKIVIEAFVHEGKNVITVTDNAGGIGENVLPNIFDPYFTTKEEGQGDGLGLYMAKMIIEEHMNGTIEAENTATGAKFILTLNTLERTKEPADEI